MDRICPALIGFVGFWLALALFRGRSLISWRRTKREYWPSSKRFQSNTFASMARRIDWDAVARQNRLKRWIRANSPFLDSMNDNPAVQDSNLDLELERWAKETVRRIAARVRTRHKNEVIYAATPLGEIESMMDELGNAIENNDAEFARRLASRILNLSIRLPLTELSAESKNEISKLVELTLQITEP